ncbi:MAG: hypothetical protein ACI9JN_002300 [Bacteroidia bacterium]|jgi:hypothetical protein
MKKPILLIGILSAAVAGYGQSTLELHQPSAKQLSDNHHQEAVDAPNFVVAPQQGAQKKGLNKYRSQVYDFVAVGNTYYDLQSNASVGRRAMLHPDGTISVAWTFSGTSSTTWPDRGAVVNYYNGTAWGGTPTTRVEGLRTGWPSIGMLADGSMYVVSHDPAAGGLIVTRNSGKDKTDWVSDASKVVEHAGGDVIWNRTANLGDKMFTLVNFYTANSDDIVIEGITNPTMFAQSDDAGKTWTPLALLPGYDSTRTILGTGDTYAIDARDSTVAIVIGGAYRDVTMFKSTDSGTTWKTTIIDSFAFPRFVWGSYLVDPANPVTCNDGSVDVLIDNNGDVHVATGRLSYSDDDTTDDLARSGSYFNLYHWSENEPTWKICGTPIDMDGQPNANGAPYDITAETTNSLGADGNPNNGLAYAARYGQTSISTHSSLSVDKNNTIYVTWDAPVEFTFNDYLANYRDVHISYSTNGGASWATSQNATQIRSQEAVYACMTKRTDEFVHFIFQMDAHPGTNVINSGTGNLHPNVENTIYYAAIPVKDLMDSVLGQNTLEVTPVINESQVFVVSQNRPNPFSNATNVVVYLRAGSDLTCTVTDATGKVVSTQNMGYKGAGNHSVLIQGSDLTSGIYFYTLKTKDSEVTKKMQVIK